MVGPEHGSARLEPKSTSVAPNPRLGLPKFEPKIATYAPPVAAPYFGDTVRTLGKTATYVYTFSEVGALVPPGVVTVMLTWPLPGGRTSTVIEVALVTVKQGAVGDVMQGVVVMAVEPTVTVEVIGLPAASKSVPVSVTLLPPAGAPAFGDTPVTEGTGATKVYDTLPVVPPGVVTLTPKVPGVLCGMVTVIWESVSKVKHGADGHGPRGDEPTFTTVAPVKFVPARTTLLPPAVEPDVGVRLANVGAGVT